MTDFNFGPIIALIIFILIPLANYVLERLKRRIEKSGSARKAPDIRGRLPESRMPAAVLPVPGGRRTTDRVVAASRGPRPDKTILATRSDVRRAVIAMTVLGPCRAYDSAD